MSRASKGNNRPTFRVRISGRVQGVGFRPLVYRVAARLSIRGRVSNTPEGAVIEATDTPGRIQTLIDGIRSSLPPSARISRVTVEKIPSLRFRGFSIVKSATGGMTTADVPADLSICPDCEAELFDPADRRYRYPFINCTQCGPRFSIIRKLPYDRPQTTMSSFDLCPRCRREYEDPRDRRFHAQPDACPECGPRLSLFDARFRKRSTGDTALTDAIGLLAAGKIVAIKSLGGFHLACRADDPAAVRRLRDRKNRPAKPFAVMLPDTGSVKRCCIATPRELEQLRSPQRPIVLLRKSSSKAGPLAGARELIAPGNGTLGVMLPYTPLHFLLFAPGKPRPFEALIMTSGNRSDEPICVTDEDARAKLSGIADAFLTHDRPIHNRCDDSILRVMPYGNGGTPVSIRRSRGFVPLPVPIPFDAVLPPVFAAGAQLKNTFTLTRGSSAYVSPYIGELDNAETLSFYEEAYRRLKRFLNVSPAVVACDLHPDYLSTRFADRISRGAGGRKPVLRRIQHHHAHIASVIAEAGLKRPVIGFAFDGTGYGADGAVWGGECFHFDGRDFRRLAHLDYFPLPGGDTAAREIWRCGLALLHGAGIRDVPKTLKGRAVSSVLRQIEKGINAPQCSSAGRLFDGVASLLGLRAEVSFEAQAAIELETLAGTVMSDRGMLDNSLEKVYNFNILSASKDSPVIAEKITLDGITRGVLGDIRSGVRPAVIAARFHLTLAEMITALTLRYRERLGIRDIVLSGGVFQNRLLLAVAAYRLRKKGFTVHFNRIVPANDGGLSLGQAWIAMNNLAQERK